MSSNLNYEQALEQLGLLLTEPLKGTLWTQLGDLRVWVKAFVDTPNDDLGGQRPAELLLTADGFTRVASLMLAPWREILEETEYVSKGMSPFIKEWRARSGRG